MKESWQLSILQPSSYCVPCHSSQLLGSKQSPPLMHHELEPYLPEVRLGGCLGSCEDCPSETSQLQASADGFQWAAGGHSARLPASMQSQWWYVQPVSLSCSV